MNKTVLIVVIVLVALSVGIVALNKSSQELAVVQRQELVAQNSSPSSQDSSVVQQVGNDVYVPYTSTAFAAAIGKKRVLYFHAPWCPTCRPTDAEFKANEDKIPGNVVLFKTDYDTESELKRKYTITYQHTFVLVDDAGNEIKKWNGGAIDELIANTQ